MDIYFENLIWKNNGKIDGGCPVRWTDPSNGNAIFDDYKSFLEKWSQLTTVQKKNVRFFLAANSLMSIRNTIEINIEKNSPIRFFDFFPSFFELIFKNRSAFFFDSYGNCLINFYRILNELKVKNSKIYSLGLSINWKKDNLTIYPSKSSITFRYGYSDFVSFPLNMDEKNLDLKNQLNLLINSLGIFKKIKIIRNNKFEVLIGSVLSNYETEFDDLNPNNFLPELLIETRQLNWKKKLYRLLRLVSNSIYSTLNVPNFGVFLAPILITLTGIFILEINKSYISENNSKIFFGSTVNSINDEGSLIFLETFVSQSESLNIVKVNLIELEVRQESMRMVGNVKFGFRDKLTIDPKKWLDGISQLKNNFIFNEKRNLWSFEINYPPREGGTAQDQSKIVSILQKLLKPFYIYIPGSNDNLLSIQSKKRVSVRLENEPIEKVNDFLVSFQKLQNSWDWVYLKFESDGENLISFNGTAELIE